MYLLEFNVKGQNIKRIDKEIPVAKCKNLFRAKFNFESTENEWTDLKTAIFVQGESAKTVLLDRNNECVVPWEFFDTENTTYGGVSVFCGDLVTADIATVEIRKSGYCESDASRPPSRDIYQQLLDKIHRIEANYKYEIEDKTNSSLKRIETEGNKQYDRVSSVIDGAISDYDKRNINIINNKHGDNITLTDSSSSKLENLIIYGRSEQNGVPTPEKPIPIVSVGEKGNINIEITGSNAESQSLNISTPNGLNGIKVSSGGNYTDNTGQQWITDEVDFDRGVYIQRIFTKTFNGSENWQSDTQGVRFRYWTSMNKSVRVSDTSSVLSMNTNFPLGERGGTSSHNNVYTIAVMMGTPSILVSLNGTETLEEFKTYLSQHPMTVMTVLQKPVEKALSSSDIQTYKALHTNYPTTIVMNDYNTPMLVKYIANVKNYFLLREEFLQKQIDEIKSALITQKTIGGGTVTIEDSSDLGIEDLKIYGRSEQTTTTGAQLFNLLTAINKWKNNSITIQGITYTLDDEGYLTMKGTSTGRSYIYLNGKDDKLQLDKGEYIISLGTALPEGVDILIGHYNAEGVYMGNLMDLRNADQRVYNLSKPTEYIDGYINIQNAGVTVDYKCRPILNKGNTPKPYEPFTGGEPSPNPNYPQSINSVGEKGNINIEITGSNAESQSLNISTPNGLNGIKVSSGGNYTDSTGQQWITDEIDFDRGVYIQRIFTKTFDGSENWNVENHTIGFRYYCLLNNKVKSSNLREFCSMNTSFPLSSFQGTKTNKNVYELNIAGGKFSAIFLTLNGSETLEDFKKYLYQSSMTIKAVLTEPLEIPLSSYELNAFKKLHTNKLTTVVTVNENCGIEIEYVVDTKFYIDKKISEISNAIVTKGV